MTKALDFSGESPTTGGRAKSCKTYEKQEKVKNILKNVTTL